MKNVLLFCLLVGFVVAEISQECKNLLMTHKHPFVCCKYPMRKVLPVHEENCRTKCSQSAGNKCCEIDCTYRETGVLVNGVFNDQAMLNLYENYLEDSGAGKYDQWMAVVEKSLKKCIELVPVSDKILTCNVSEYVINISDCLNLMNYLDCPTFERTSECEKARNFIKSLDKCGNKVNGTVLINYQYWDFRVLDISKRKIL